MATDIIAIEKIFEELSYNALPSCGRGTGFLFLVTQPGRNLSP